MVPPSISSIPRPPFGSSPIARPSGNPGAAASGVAKVGEAVDLLEKALSEIPPAHPGHEVVLKTISNLNKHFPPQARAPGTGVTELKQLLASKMQQSPLAGLLAGRGGAPGGAPMGAGMPGMGGGMPPMPPMGGAEPPV